MKWIKGGVTAPAGFMASGASAGIKRSREPDMALVVSEAPAAAAGVFTTNKVQAAPVKISKERLASGVAEAVLLNSGCANCLTGASGLEDALRLSRLTASELGISEGHVLLASTGVIGRRLPVRKMQRAIPALARGLRRKGHRQAALAILTTDTRIKEAAVACKIGGRLCHVGGMAKGAGMIAPAMATMLCVLTTDAGIDRALLKRLLYDAVEASFNRISVDADMSTNDAVFLLANGCSNVRLPRGTAAMRQFARMLNHLTQRLARLIVEDGEGATRLATINVAGARTDAQALVCARRVASSSLVRTMLASGDPNVGRIAAAAGASGATFSPEKLEIEINGHRVVHQGLAQRLGKSLARQLFSPHELLIKIDLHAGNGKARMVTCDLTEEYVRLNARYPT